MTLRSNLIYSALLAASAVAAPAAWAQVQEPAPPAEEFPSPAQETAPSQSADAPSTRDSTTATAPITDQKIEQFANAYVAVQGIQEKAASDLQTAKDPASADKVKQTAESDMIAAVQKSGLQVEEFNSIVQTMTADATVRERVAVKLQERQGGGGSP
ncbi:MAG: DUF4168 domain-containing protein [Steroidobacter sp.]